jgi:hypothetical protein
MTIERWPNHLGWSKHVTHGEATIMDDPVCRPTMRVAYPIAPEIVGYNERHRRPVMGDRYRACLVPNGTDPAEAFRRCRYRGVIVGPDDRAPSDFDLPLIAD